MGGSGNDAAVPAKSGGAPRALLIRQEADQSARLAREIHL